MQNEIRAHGAVNDIIDNAVEHSAARTIQNQFRNNRAINEVIDRLENKIKHQNKAATRLQKVFRGHQGYKQFLNEEQRQQGIINNLEELVNNKVKMANIVATKKDIIEGRAAEILQAAARRKTEKGLMNKRMEDAGDQLGTVKRERASNRIKAGAKTKLTYQYKDAAAAHETKQTGQPLVILKGTEGPNPKFILKSRHDRGVKAAESRKIREELSEKYKSIMQKPYKIVSEKFKGKNRFNPL